ncbi:MAG: hypothetical protein GY922_10955 [Proteobacteria bacterium]|nr:hypothetical protein [Pseudomonadota bacterium]
MAKALLVRGISPIDNEKLVTAESLDAQLRPLWAEAGNGEPRLGPASHWKSFHQNWAFTPNRLGDSLTDFA